MIRRIFLASAGALALAGTAFAADLAPPPPVLLPPPPLWTGFYAGVNAGYEWSASNSVDVVSAVAFNNTALLGPLGLSYAPAAALGATRNIPLNSNGFIGGGQIGYNYQTGRMVLGIETDIQASNQSNSATWNVPGVGDLTVGHKIPYFGTIRGRLGYAFTCGCVMAYGTLGLAYGAYEPYATALGVTVSQTYTNSSTFVGGVGVEWMVAPQWSVKLEGLYFDTGNVGGLTLPVVGTIHARLRDAIMRVGVNYHF